MGRSGLSSDSWFTAGILLTDANISRSMVYGLNFSALMASADVCRPIKTTFIPKRAPKSLTLGSCDEIERGGYVFRSGIGSSSAVGWRIRGFPRQRVCHPHFVDSGSGVGDLSLSAWELVHSLDL
jgi:hypothetical protein